jgi:Transposase DDE domain
MAHPIIIQESTLRNYLGAYREAIRPAQWTYFETVLMGLIHCQASHTLSGLLRSVAVWVTVWDLSRFLVSPRWSAASLAEARYRFFGGEVQPLVAAAHAEQRLNRSKQPGRPKATVVTGYLILDDSTHVKRYAKKMGGQGQHYSSTDRRTMPGHSLFQGLYWVAGHQYPLDPQMYIQKAVCEQEQRPFRSKVDLAVQVVEHFEPLPDTQTHVLIDSWYVNKRMWKAVRERHWDLTGGLKANHKLRTQDAEGQRIWVRLDDFAAELPGDRFQPIPWPSQTGETTVYAHMLRTRVKKLGACQVLIVKPTAEAGADQARFYLTTRLEDPLAQVVQTVALRWTVETLFADFKELMGSDQYQLHSAEAIQRFWALGLCLYQYLDSLRHRLARRTHRHVTMGETLAWLRHRHETLRVNWICWMARRGTQPPRIQATLAPALAPLSLANC